MNSGKAIRMAEEVSAILNSGYRGLCSTCKSVKYCTYQRDPEHPVLQCDEFQGIESTARQNKDNAIWRSLNSLIKSNIENDDEDEYLGLCKNCENRKSCTFTKPEGGIWHCEEYQ